MSGVQAKLQTFFSKYYQLSTCSMNLFLKKYMLFSHISLSVRERLKSWFFSFLSRLTILRIIYIGQLSKAPFSLVTYGQTDRNNHASYKVFPKTSRFVFFEGLLYLFVWWSWWSKNMRPVFIARCWLHWEREKQ